MKINLNRESQLSIYALIISVKLYSAVRSKMGVRSGSKFNLAHKL
jgi:hypothetical protein